MLRILGSEKRLCDGSTRREALRVGGLGLAGLGLADFFRISQTQAAQERVRSFGKAKACILLYLYGSPSQLETFDPKPAAPPEIRGTLGTIKSSLPGADVGELLPRISRVMHKMSVVRSVTHKFPLHGAAYALTGVPAIDVPMELNPRDSRHHPFIGSVVEYLTGGKRREVPTNIALPFPFSTRRTGEVQRAGPYAAFLGAAHNPIWTNFRGEATASMKKILNAQKIDVPEPYMGITPEGRFEIAAGTDAPADMSLERLGRRRSLMERFDRGRQTLESSEAGKSFDRFHGMALDLVRSTKVRSALDLAREPARVRESYGMTLFGQGCLAARRLVEAGSRFVSVFWDEYGLAGSAWDTHWDHYARMKKELCPGFDHGLSGLLNDLDARGLLDETVILCVSEHGRTPKMNKAAGGGRDHWSQAYSAVMAGGGVARGLVVGRTDKIAGEVADNPISPKDLLATTYHLLGIDPGATIQDRQGRPAALVQDGRVLTDILA